MAIANGMCASSCNQPKAHFGLPWVRPWDNRGKCHTDEKRIQCLLNASQHAHICRQQFPSNSTRKFKSSPFLHIFARFGLPWVRPWEIAVNVTWIHYIFNRLRAIARYWSEIATFSYHLAFNAPVGGVPIIPGKVWSSKN